MITKSEDKKARWLYKYRDSIDLDPFFQRGKVWNKGKQQYFIDSVIKGWGTPKIFLQATGKDVYACLDGKQRLTSLFGFMEGEFALGSRSEPELSGKRYSELPRDIQDAFDDYEFTIELISDTDQDEVVELYKRLQGGTPLNFAEKIFAYPGNMTKFIKTVLLPKKFFVGVMALADTRYAHYAVGSQLSLLILKGGKEDLKINNIEKLFKDYVAFNTRSPEAKKILEVLEYLEAAFPNPKEPALKNRANIVSAFNLVADLSARGNIVGHEEEIGNFFRKFIKSVQQEFDKAPDQRDPSIISYQSAVTQGADKMKSVNTRHEILLKKIALSNKFFSELVRPPSLNDDFIALFEAARKKAGSKNIGQFDLWLVSHHGLKANNCKKKRAKVETYIGHIRNCIAHTEHGKFSTRDLDKAMKLLSGLV